GWTPRGQGRRHHRRMLRHRAGDRAPVRRGGRPGRHRRPRRHPRSRAGRRAGDHLRPHQRHRPGPGGGALPHRQGHLRLGRHRVQQRRDLTAGGRLHPRHRPRRLAQGAGGQPHQRLPLLQGRPAAHAGAGEGVDHQHRVVRGGDGRRDLPDLLLRLEGRRAVDESRARRPVRAAGRPRQRAVPRTGQHAPAPGALRQGRGAGRPAPGPRPHGSLRRAGGDGQRRAVPRLRRVLLHHRVHVPGRRRHLRRLRHPAV
ncbi:MAG: Short-chain dehydrogenase/reductase in hypothetical Actinobacterial gene cluster, partial [uncultured Friedmanniella sp.]